MADWSAFRTIDADIEASLVHGDLHRAFDTLARGYQAALLSFCRKLLAGVYEGDAVEEVVQEILLAAYKALPRYRSDASVRTWIFAIARKQCFQELRNHFRRTRLHEEHHRMIGELAHRNPLEALETGALQEEALHCLRFSLSALRKKERDLLVMRYIEGCALAELAQRYYIAETTVRERLARALDHLRAVYLQATRVP